MNSNTEQHKVIYRGEVVIFETANGNEVVATRDVDSLFTAISHTTKLQKMQEPVFEYYKNTLAKAERDYEELATDKARTISNLMNYCIASTIGIALAVALLAIK